MQLREPIVVAALQLWSNKVRTLLTVLGILIGVGSVVGIVSIGEGLRQTVVSEFDRIGGGSLIVVFPPAGWVRQGDRWVRRPWQEWLHNQDAVRIRAECQHIRSVLAIVEKGGRVSRGKVDTSPATNEVMM